ncbi:MAG: hypothetical protein HOO93_01675 [Methyloglobulus sp.]|nr:hypothetical protein [Methyloglobulus sp.]
MCCPRNIVQGVSLPNPSILLRVWGASQLVGRWIELAVDKDTFLLIDYGYKAVRRTNHRAMRRMSAFLAAHTALAYCALPR